MAAPNDFIELCSVKNCHISFFHNKAVIAPDWIKNSVKHQRVHQPDSQQLQSTFSFEGNILRVNNKRWNIIQVKGKPKQILMTPFMTSISWRLEIYGLLRKFSRMSFSK